MRYPTNNDLPFVCRINLPEAALELWRDAFNEAWMNAGDPKTRHREAQAHAFAELRRCFEKDCATGRWIPREPAIDNRAHLAVSSADGSAATAARAEGI